MSKKKAPAPRNAGAAHTQQAASQQPADQEHTLRKLLCTWLFSPACGIFAVAVIAWWIGIWCASPNMMNLFKEQLKVQKIQNSEDCLADLMLYEPLNITLPDPFIARDRVYPSLSDVPFQHWDGPKTIGKTMEAYHLAFTEKQNGNPVLLLSYKDTDQFDAFRTCFHDSTTTKEYLNVHRQAVVSRALAMFRREGNVRTGVGLDWDKVFPSGYYPYNGGGLPLLIIDDLDRASKDDAMRWVALGRKGKQERTFRTIILTSPGQSRTNVALEVSDIMTAKSVTFRDFSWKETQIFLEKHLGIQDKQRQCEIWHVVGGRPGELASVERSFESTVDIEAWRMRLIHTAGKVWVATRERLSETLQADADNMIEVLAKLLATDSSRCISLEELASECGITESKRIIYWHSLREKIINAGSVLFEDDLCMRFETKPMQDYASRFLANLTLVNLADVKC